MSVLIKHRGGLHIDLQLCGFEEVLACVFLVGGNAIVEKG